jgi:c(7)-type cytochrome triheme protein
MMTSASYRLLLVCSLSLLALTCSNHLYAMDSDGFLNDFIHNYDSQAFESQATLVKENQALVAEAVNSLISQAMSDASSFEERMQLLNIASALAYMNLHWHGDDLPLKQIEPIIQNELEKEQARIAVIMKWKKEERLLGNFVMKKHRTQMEEQGLSMVLYPHWMHRIIYKCKVCHDGIFKMKRWENNLSQAAIVKGEQCGVCHNGKIAFDAADKESCERCHIVGLPAAEHLHNPGMVRQEKISQAAKRAGASWLPENLPDGKLPVDKFQFIDWIALKDDQVFSPLGSLDQGFTEETRDNKIVFESKSNFVNDVIFDHKIHSDWLSCANCHQTLFKDELGGNNIKMTAISQGRFCGHCHGKVSFSFGDCLRCHKQSIGKLSADKSRQENVLRRTKQ